MAPISAPPDASLRDRPPASAVIVECLHRQQHATPRGTVARILGLSPLHPDARSWYTGALGELHVARGLSHLGADWTVLHSVPVGAGDSDIDHVAIGPAGVFTINTKFHEHARIWVGERRILVNGHPVDHVLRATHEADRAARILTTSLGAEVPAQGILAIVGSREITVKRQPERVTVISDRKLASWLKHRRPLAGFDASAVARIAEDPATWHARGADAVVEADLARFAVLRREVSVAARIRALWMLGAIAAVVLGTWVFTASRLAGLG